MHVVHLASEGFLCFVSSHDLHDLYLLTFSFSLKSPMDFKGKLTDILPVMVFFEAVVAVIIW